MAVLRPLIGRVAPFSDREAWRWMVKPFAGAADNLAQAASNPGHRCQTGGVCGACISRALRLQTV